MGGWKKMPKNWVKKTKEIFFLDLNKYQSVTHVSTCIFQGLFKNIIFRSVALVKNVRQGKSIVYTLRTY